MAQPNSYQEMLNNLLPTKQVGGQTYVPRITQNSGSLSQLNDFDHWHNNNHTHVGLDLAYSRLNPQTGQVEYIPTSNAINHNVSVGAPISGAVRVLGDAYHTVEIVGPTGYVFRILHMDKVDASLNGQYVEAGTHLGIMSNAGLGANGARHVHFGIYRNEDIETASGAVSTDKIWYDPKQFFALGEGARHVVNANSRMHPEDAVNATLASQAWCKNGVGVNFR